LIFGIVACYGLKEDSLRHTQANLFTIFFCWNQLAAGNPGHIGDNGFYLIDIVIPDPLSD